MGKSVKLFKSLILGAKAFSKDGSGGKREQSNKIRSQRSLGKAYSCGYDPDDDTEDQQDSNNNEHIGHGIPEGVFTPVIMNSDPQSETTVANENSESGSSDSVVKPDNDEVSSQEQGAVSRTNEEISIEENAAIAIQAALRGFLCRRDFRALKAVMRFQDLADGQIVKEKTAMDSTCMQALINVQARIRAKQVQMSEEGQAVQQKRQLRARNAKSQEDWDHRLATFDELQAKLQNRKDAAMRRERALAYAFSQQLRICGQRKSQQAVGDCIHPDQQPNLGWTWLERWMAARLSDTNTELEKDIKKNHYLIMDDKNKLDTTASHQYGKIKRNKKTIDKQPILSPTESIPYNNPTAAKSTSPYLAKNSLSRTPAISPGSLSHESPNNKSGKRHSTNVRSFMHSTDLLIERPTYSETGHHHHQASNKKQLFFADENNKEDVSQAEESCGSNVICSSPEIKAKDDSSSTKSSSHDHPKLRHKSSSGNGPTKLRIPSYLSTTKSSKPKVPHSIDPTKPEPQPITAKATTTFVSSSDLSL